MNITAYRNWWIGLSASLMLTSLIAILSVSLNLGLDFTGGARWDVTFEEPITKNQLQVFFDQQSSLKQSAQIQSIDEISYLITIPDLSDQQTQELQTSLATEVGTFETKAYRKVDARIGSSLKTKAAYAIMTALIGIILFVAWAFRHIPAIVNPWRFGGLAIIALLHDIIILLGIFVLLGSITGVELDLPFVTALLATLGFSVNDTIVILDRVRENLGQQKPQETFADTVEKSIQQTIRRSINTSVSTLLPLFGLLFFGAESIFYFVLALIVGIAIGTYSSIFLAAPLLVSWKEYQDNRSTKKPRKNKKDK